MNPTAIVAAMAALEEWCAREGALLRGFDVERTGENPRLPWVASGLLWQPNNVATHASVECPGASMADALSNLAQVVIADPDLLSFRAETDSMPVEDCLECDNAREFCDCSYHENLRAAHANNRLH